MIHGDRISTLRADDRPGMVSVRADLIALPIVREVYKGSHAG